MQIRLPDPNCVVKVGKGRGFIIEHSSANHLSRRLIVTAAHCLPVLPLAHGASYTGERTFANLIGGIATKKKPKIWAQCLFADPIADIAVLMAVDDYDVPRHAELFESFTESVDGVEMASPKRGDSSGYMLSLDGKWTKTRLKIFEGVWGASVYTDENFDGQSGSPILNAEGQAIATVTIGGSMTDGFVGPQTILFRSLPAWLVEDATKSKRPKSKAAPRIQP